MSSPVENRIGQVFVPITNMERAIGWYSRILGLPIMETTHDGAIYNVQMVGETWLALDASKSEIANSSQPLFFFWTRDIRAARNFLEISGVQSISEIEDIGSVSFVVFKDPDENLLMVCRHNDQSPV